jgi:YebC/PmpR family DNA-binding regulatory protein
MSGHSKWATIKRKKGAADAKRGKLFTKLIRELATAARMGGGDPGANPRLRLAVEKARAANMPKDTLSRAILRGTGGGEEAVFEEVVYEGYGPGGTAVLVEGLTDNRNRTVGEVRHAFTKAGASLGAPGCVAHLFEKKGLVSFDAQGLDGDALLEAALEAGADDVREGADQWMVVTAPAAFEAVKSALEQRGFRAAQAELTLEPSTTVALAGGEAEAMLKLAEALEDLDDVQAVYANFDIPDEVMQRLAG